MTDHALDTTALPTQAAPPAVERLAVVPVAPVGEPAPTPDPHDVVTVDHGPFTSAVCSCGWRGVARRSRPLARSEAADHLTLHSPGPPDHWA